MKILWIIYHVAVQFCGGSSLSKSSSIYIFCVAMNNVSNLTRKLALCAAMIATLSSCAITPEYIIKHPYFSWVQDSTNRFYIHMEKRIWTKERMDSVKIAMEENYAVTMKKLQTDFFPFDRIHHFLVEDPHSIVFLIRTRHPDWISWYVYHDVVDYFLEYPIPKDSLGVHSITNRYLITTFGHNGVYSREKDLLSTIILRSLWKNDYSLYLSSSIGVYVNDSWYGYDLHDLAAYFYRNNYRYKQLGYFFSFVSDNITFPMIASLLKFSADKYGMPYVKQNASFEASPLFPLNTTVVSEWEAMLNERNSKPSPIDTIRYFSYYPWNVRTY
ncbi:MAG: hypothetical protein ACOVSW_23895 [Candidatus Kapaibacteriota bacterium]